MKLFFCIPLTLLSIFLSQSTYAQSQSQNDSVVNVINRLFENFQTAKDMSFDVGYTYSNESAPTIVLDSLSGKFEMHGVKYHFLLDSTETIRNEHYTIVLFHEDKIMYLTKGTSNIAGNPVESIAAFLKNNKSINCSLVSEGGIQHIRITYPPGQEYKQIAISFDTATGHILKAVYIVQTKLLLEQDAVNDDAGAAYDNYARVEADFSHYRVSQPDTSVFDEQKFFYKEGTQYKTTEAFKDYKIFIGSSNL